MYNQYKSRGFVILGFPCNQFGGQEPGTNNEILQFVTSKYKVSFPLFAKIDVNGPAAHSLFVFLRSQLKGILGSSIKWNFTKFLCDRNGRPVQRYAPTTFPIDFRQDVESLL